MSDQAGYPDPQLGTHASRLTEPQYVISDVDGVAVVRRWERQRDGTWRITKSEVLGGTR